MDEWVSSSWPGDLVEQERGVVCSEALLQGPSYPQDLSELTKDYYFLISSSRPQLNQPHPWNTNQAPITEKQIWPGRFPASNNFRWRVWQEGVETSEHLDPGNILHYRTFMCLSIDSFSKHLISTCSMPGPVHVASSLQQAFRAMYLLSVAA